MTIFYLYPENVNENEFKEMNLLVCWKKFQKSLIFKLWPGYYCLMFLPLQQEIGEKRGRERERGKKRLENVELHEVGPVHF